MAEQLSAKRFGCPSCGGGLRYLPGRGTLQCQMCGSEYPPEQLDGGSSPAPDGEIEVNGFTCPQCGATIVSRSTEATSFCTFCGSDVVLMQKMTHMRRPDLIVPFTHSREVCEHAYRLHLRKYPFAPSSLKSQETVSHFRPVYIPFWAYDVSIDGIQQFSYIRRYNNVEDTKRAEMEISYRDTILFDASVAFEDETAVQLSAGIKNAQPFSPAFLSGMYAQIPDVGPEVYEHEARASAMLVCTDRIQKKVNSQEITYLPSGNGPEQETGLSNITVSHRLVLLPVWLLASRRGERVLYTAVNDQNLKVVCDVPVSHAKTALLAGGIAAVIFAFLFLAGSMPITFWMIASAVAAILTLRLTTRIYRIGKFHELREAEPDFTGSGPYTGQLQSRLKKAFGLNTYGRIGKKTVNRKQDVLPAVLIGILGILFFPIVTLLLSVAAYGSVTSHLSNLSVVFKVFAAAFLLWSMIDSISTLRGMLPHPGKAAFISAVSLAYTVNAAMIAVSMINPAEDWIYYGLTILSLVLTVLLLLVILRLQNRFATRPVPDFTGEEEA